MLERYASALESLVIASSNFSLSIFSGLSFPALRTLDIWSGEYGGYNDVVVQLGSQLTSLSLRSYTGPAPPGTKFSFPHLVELRLTDYPAQDCAALIGGCGPAVKLALNFNGAVPAEIAGAAWLSRLTELQVQSYTHPFPLELATQLRSFALDLRSEHHLAQLSGTLKCAVTRLRLYLPGTLRTSQLATMTKLIQLDIRGIARLHCDATLPAMRDLTVRYEFPSRPASFGELLFSLHCFPMLTKLCIYWRYSDAEDGEKLVPLTEAYLVETVDRILTLVPQLEHLELSGPDMRKVTSRRRWPWCYVSV